VAMEPAAFNAWVQQAKGAGGTLDPVAYARLVRPSMAVPPATFGTVDPRLFETALHLTVR
jgi:cytochrome o ubiquinol oxidase subunit 2